MLYCRAVGKGPGASVNSTQLFGRNSKDKSPEVPFHRISSSYSYLEEFEFLRQEARMQEKMSDDQK